MIRREAIREFAGGSLWLLPSIAALIAMVAGYTISHIRVADGSPLARLAFQGTADDARTLLVTISGTVVTVLALVLGLTVVALQLASTQFSPRLLRNFLRDRPNQVVLSIFLATFAYSAAGLYTVGVVGGNRVEDFPRLAVSGAIFLLFATLGTVVYFADHLAHSIQIDAIMRRVERQTLAVIATVRGSGQPAPTPPEWAIPLTAPRSGYLQTAHPEAVLPLAARHGVTLCLRQRVGEHVVEGSTVGWVWAAAPDQAVPDVDGLQRSFTHALSIGFERTFQQDAAFGIRQLVDVACRALSPAVNDPYTAVQAVDHLTVIFCALASRPLGAVVEQDAEGRAVVAVPARQFGDYLATMCGLLRRYGAREPTVMVALLRLLGECAAVGTYADRRAGIDEQVRLVLADSERACPQPADRAEIHAAVAALLPPPHSHD